MYFALKYMSTSQIILKPLGLENKWLRLQGKKNFSDHLADNNSHFMLRPKSDSEYVCEFFSRPRNRISSKEILAIIWTTWVQESVIWIYLLFSHSLFSWSTVSTVN